jgi:hypothetical protein
MAVQHGLGDCYVGVKPFEKALLDLFESDVVPRPVRTRHPALGHDGEVRSTFSWSDLHPMLHPTGAGVPRARAGRKCWQLEALCSITQLLADDFRSAGRESIHIVDFAAGCGPLGLPLAALLPWATVTIVELKKRSLDIARARAAEAGLSNVRFFEGDLGAFHEPFDIGVALHACGTASDLVLKACVDADARFVVCPCCTGKLSTDRRDYYRFAATGTNETRVAYPRSQPVCKVLTVESYNFLACAADVSDAGLLAGSRGLLRRLAKCFLEHDRALWLGEQGYDARLTRMPHGRNASPKCDILFGWQSDAPPAAVTRDTLTCTIEDEDVAEAESLGMGTGTTGTGTGTSTGTGTGVATIAETGCMACSTDREPTASRLGGTLGASEWSSEELEKVSATLRGLKVGDSLQIGASSGRKRRLVHFAAARLGLHHQTVTPTSAGKGAVVVRRIAPNTEALAAGAETDSATQSMVLEDLQAVRSMPWSWTAMGVVTMGVAVAACVAFGAVVVQKKRSS